jgi:hypothetical protein
MFPASNRKTQKRRGLAASSQISSMIFQDHPLGTVLAAALKGDAKPLPFRPSAIEVVRQKGSGF